MSKLFFPSLALLFFVLLIHSNQLPNASASSLYTRLASIHRAHKYIHSILKSGNASTASLQSLEPTLKSLKASKMGNALERCYNASIGAETVNIFTLPLTDVLKRFVSFNYHLFVLKDHKEIRKRVKNLLKSVRLLARTVAERALKMKKDSAFKPTTLGLNMFSAFVR